MKAPDLSMLFPHPALLIKGGGRRYLVISDLHIGFEERFASKGIAIEASTENMLRELLAIIEGYGPDEVVILGDLKYSVGRISRAEWENVPRFLEGVSSRIETTIVPGNHDGGILPLIPTNVNLVSGQGLSIGVNYLLHGHTKASRRFMRSRRIIMGHVHPSYKRGGSTLSGQQAWVLMRAKRKGLFEGAKGEGMLEVVVIPAFNRELSAAFNVALGGEIISPVLRKLQGNIDEAYILTLDGDLIGDASSLKFVL